MEYRKESGEDITEESWLMRNIRDTRIGAKRGVISKPKKLEPAGVKRIVKMHYGLKVLERNWNLESRDTSSKEIMDLENGLKLDVN